MKKTNNIICNLSLSSSVFVLLALVSYYVVVPILSVRNGYFIPPTILFLTTVGLTLFSKQFRAFQLCPHSKRVVGAFVIYAIITMLIIFYHQDRFPSRIKIEGYALLILPLTWLIAYRPPSLRLLFLGLALASVVILSVGIYDVAVLSCQRALCGRQPLVPASGITVIIGLFCYCGAGFAHHQGDRIGVVLGLLGFIFATVCALLTGTRGVWLCLPFAIVFITYFQFSSSRRVLWFVLIIFISLCFLLYCVPQTGVEARLSQAVTDVKAYDEGLSATSLGVRIKLWLSALEAVQHKPWLGYGYDGFFEYKQKQLSEGLMLPVAAEMINVHNVILDILFKKGIVGLLAYSLIIIQPFLYFMRYLRAENAQQKTIAVMGIILVGCSLSFAMTDSFTMIPISMVFYVFTMMMLVGLMNACVNRLQ